MTTTNLIMCDGCKKAEIAAALLVESKPLLGVVCRVGINEFHACDADCARAVIARWLGDRGLEPRAPTS
jgi:hypothetical protein